MGKLESRLRRKFSGEKFQRQLSGPSVCHRAQVQERQDPLRRCTSPESGQGETGAKERISHLSATREMAMWK